MPADGVPALTKAVRYIVSDEHAFVFFEVPKVAVTSLKTALAPLLGIDTTGADVPREGGRGSRFVIHDRFARSGHRIDKEEFLASLDKYRGYFKFGFVRNPFDRLVSLYSDKIVGAGRGLGERAGTGIASRTFYKGMPFAEFVRGVHSIPDEVANLHFRSQHVSLCGPDGEVLADFVGRFENLAADFSRVAREIGAPDLALPHILRSEDRRAYRDYYDENLKNLVRERYSEDLELFGYSF